MFHRLGLMNKNQKGFTLIELMVAIAIAGLITGSITTAIFQIFDGNTRSSNHMTAIRQVQNAGDWITNDTLGAQEVYVMPGTRLTSDIDYDDTVIIVDDTSAFPSSGLIIIEQEIISYSGKTPTSFTGITRGANAADYDEASTVTFYVRLEESINDTDDEIEVNSTHGFPASGVICIEDELIQYSSKTDTEFTGCIRGTNAATHADDAVHLSFLIQSSYYYCSASGHNLHSFAAIIFLYEFRYAFSACLR